MAPSRKSRSVNKRFSGIDEVDTNDDAEYASKSRQMKRKWTGKIGPKWTKEELERFYKAFRKHGKDWEKVAAVVRSRSVGMVEALYSMNTAYLSLPKSYASAAGLIAMMTDHCSNQGDQEQFLSAGSMSSHDSSCAGPTLVRGSRQTGVKTDEGWRLTTEAEGGPRVIDLIPSFGAHIAHRLWTHANYRLLSDMSFRKHHKPLQRCQDYVWKNPGARDFVQASGLSHLSRCMSSHVDVALLTAFIERWQPDTNTFHMPFGEITITLHDVYHILRIPIAGFDLSSVPDSKPYIVVLAGLLELSQEQVESLFFRSGAFSVLGLLDHIGADNVPYPTCETSVYLFCLLGSTLFCNTTGSHAPVGIFAGLENVRDVDTYAWGAAALAHMYRALGKASRAQCKTFVGCQTLLQSWIYEYFPSLRCRGCPEIRADGVPLAGRWDGARIAPRTALEGQKRLCMLREQLDRLTHTHVEWLPYGVRPYRDDALWSLYRGCIHAFDYMEPHDPTRVLRQYGFRQTHGVARIAPTRSPPERRPEDPKSYSVTYPPCDYQTPGALVALDVFSSPSVPGAEDGNVEPKVMAWYLARTHPYILPASLAAAAAGTLAGTSSLHIMRRYIDVSALLFEPQSEEEFATRVTDMYAIVQSMRRLYLEYMGVAP